MSVDRGMDKEDVVHIYFGILLSHKKTEIMLFAATWMDLEIIILSEVIQKEKANIRMAFFFFFFFDHPLAHGSSQTRDQIQARTATHATAATMLDP